MLQAMHQKGEKGFTLVELMIVVAIIGILAAIAIPQFAAYRIRGFNSSALSDVKNLATSQAAFAADWQLYGRTGLATTALNVPDAVPLTSPGSVTANIIAQWVNGNNRQIGIGIGNGVTVFAQTDATATTFTAGAKHLQSDTTFGVDSDSSATYRNPILRKAGEPLLAANIPAATSAVDDFAAALAAVGWVAQ